MIATQALRQLPILMLISFDGFRYDYLSPSLTPNLYELSRDASLGHMLSMYVTKTFPNHFSMATGLYEDEHEIINNKMFDPRLNSTFKPGVNSRDWWDFKGQAFPIWTANQVIGQRLGETRYSGSMMYPGSSTPYRDTMPEYVKDYDTVRNWTQNVDTVLEWMTDPDKPANFVSMYFDDPDSTAHKNGPWGAATLEAVRRIDNTAGYLVKRLRDADLASSTNILFVSDHGMAEVKNIIYLSDSIDTSGFEMHGNTPDWSVFVKPERLHEKNKIFRELLVASKKNHFRIYKRSDIPPEYHYSKTPRIGDFFLVVDETFDLFKERPANPTPLPPIWGNHGWKPTQRDMRPLFMAFGPSFRPGYYHSEPFPNIDLFPLMAFLLDLPADGVPNNGSLARIIDIIDAAHFNLAHNTNHALQLAYVIILGAMILVILGIVFTVFASAKKPKYKRQNFEFDDLAPGLNIDIGYYLTDDQMEYKRKKKKKDEMLSLLSTS